MVAGKQDTLVAPVQVVRVEGFPQSVLCLQVPCVCLHTHLEVVKHILLVGLAACIPPRDAIFTTTPEVGLRVHSIVASKSGQPAS